MILDAGRLATDHPDNAELRGLYLRHPALPGSSSLIPDFSVRRRNAVIVNAPPVDFAPGGQLGWKFNGSNQSATAYNPSGAPGLTVAFWWKTTSASSNWVAVGWYNLIWIGLSAGKLAFYPNSGGQAIEPTAIANDGKWRRCVATHLNGTSKVFVNGVERASAAGTLYTTAVIATVGIGQFGNNASFFFPGSLAGIRIHAKGFPPDWAARDYRYSQSLEADPRLACFNRPSIFLPLSSFTATVGLTAGAASLAATTKFTNPSYTAAAAFTSGPASLSAAVSFTNPSYTAAASLASGPATLVASASFTVGTYTAAVAILAPPAALSAATTFTKPSYTAAVSLTCGAAVLASSATFTRPVYAAAASMVAGAATLNGAAAFTKPSYIGTASLTTAPASFSGAAGFDKPVFSSTVAIVAAAARVAANATASQPSVSASVSFEAGGAEFSGAVNFDQPVYAAIGSLIAAGAQVAVSANFSATVYSASVSLTAGAALLAASADFDSPIFSAAANLTVAGVLFGATATVATDSPDHSVSADGRRLHYRLEAGPVSYVLEATLVEFGFSAEPVNYAAAARRLR
jgi:hypothetical protein